MLKFQFRCWEFFRKAIVFFLATSVIGSSVHAQVAKQVQQPLLFQSMSPPHDADIHSLEALVRHYKLESRFYSPHRQQFFVDSDNFEPILLSVLNYFDELIATGNVDAVREEDTAIIQRFRATYAAKFTAMRAILDYLESALSVRNKSLFEGISGSYTNTLSQSDISLLATKSPCFHPTFLQPDSVNVRVLRSLARKYNVVLPPSKGSATSALLENRPIARHEFAAALDPVLAKAVERFKVNPYLVPEQDRVTLQRLYDEYAIELTPKVLLGVHTKLYTYCQN